MEQPIALSVVIPAHNAAHLIESTVARLAGRLAGQNAEILVVENGSTDGTEACCERIAEGWTATTPSFVALRAARGMGNALRAGIIASRGAAVLLTADDLPFGFDDLDAFEQMRDHAKSPMPPAIIGSKSHRDSAVDRGAYRGAMTRAFGFLRRIALGMHTGDPQGTFIVAGDLVRRLAPEIPEPGFLFTTELAYVLEQLGIRPLEVPVRLSSDHAAHGSRVSLQDAVAMATGLLRLRSRHRHRWSAQSLPG